MCVLNFVLLDSKRQHNKPCAQCRHLFPEFNLMSNVFVHEFLIFYSSVGPKYTKSFTILRISLPPFMSVSVLHSVQHNRSAFTVPTVSDFPPTINTSSWRVSISIPPSQLHITQLKSSCHKASPCVSSLWQTNLFVGWGLLKHVISLKSLCYSVKLSAFCYVPLVASLCYSVQLSAYCYVPLVASLCYSVQLWAFCYVPLVARLCYSVQLSAFCCVLLVASFCCGAQLWAFCYIPLVPSLYNIMQLWAFYYLPLVASLYYTVQLSAFFPINSSAKSTFSLHLKARL